MASSVERQNKRTVKNSIREEQRGHGTGHCRGGAGGGHCPWKNLHFPPETAEKSQMCIL